MSDPNDPRGNGAWERQVMERLLSDALVEQRRRRRWGVFFRLLLAVYVGIAMISVVEWERGDDHGERHTAMVTLNGVIEAKGEANAENMIAALQSAFEDANSAGIILRINSPGGSPVQAGLINDEIRRLRAKYSDKPVYAVIEDICASGGYYVAVAADRIYVDKASIVGSIGVLMDGFGFTGTMERVGVERRLLTAGENKGFLDPFSPSVASQRQHAQAMLGEIHQQFIDVVKAGRGERLKETPEMFSGLMWTGARSVELGLADAVGSVDSVARDVIKVEKVIDYSVKENLAERFAKRLGAGAVNGLWQGFSEKVLAARLY